MATLALLLNGGPQAATSSVRAAVSVRDCYIGAAQDAHCPLRPHGMAAKLMPARILMPQPCVMHLFAGIVHHT